MNDEELRAFYNAQARNNDWQNSWRQQESSFFGWSDPRGTYGSAQAAQREASGMRERAKDLVAKLRRDGGYACIMPSEKRALSYALQQGWVLLVRDVTQRGKLSDCLSVTRSGHRLFGGD